MDNNDNVHAQLIKLGDMMGDGLHHEPDGKWIEREYKKIFDSLYPEHKKAARLKKAILINDQIKKLLERIKCKNCSGQLKQSRSGSRIVYCLECNGRFKAVSNKPV